MFISRKNYNNAIREAVEKALREHDERRWMGQRMEEMERRLDKLSRQVWELEQELHPMKPSEVANLASRND